MEQRALLQPIKLRDFKEPDRAELQARVVAAVQRDPESFLERYVAHPRSFGGRYINSDLMKEVFPEYGRSPETRCRYNAVIHNSAAVLASEQFRRAVRKDSRGVDAPFVEDEVGFITGVPGAGKSSRFFREPAPSIHIERTVFPARFRAVYEGQLSNPVPAAEKIQLVLAAGLKPGILVIHTTPEIALLHTLKRFAQIGRGASLEAMAEILGRLPDGLAVIHARFGDIVELNIVDARSSIDVELLGWEHLPTLRSEGSYGDVRRRLADLLEKEWAAGRISEDAYCHAKGQVVEAPSWFGRADEKHAKD